MMAGPATNVSDASGLEKRQQVGVELILMRVCETVRSSRVHLERCILDEARRRTTARIDADNLIVIGMHDESRHIDLPEVVGEVGLGEGLDAVVRVLVTGLHPLHPERVNQPLRHLRAGAVEAEERTACEITIELRTVG